MSVLGGNLPTKVCSIVTLYIWDSTLMAPYFCTKNEIIDFQKNIFNERFGECSVCYTSKDPINDESHMYKVTTV